MYYFDVSSIESPLVDILVQVPDSVLDELKLPKNNMKLITQEECDKILKHISSYKTTIEPGGSAANSLQAMALLGCKTGYCGMVGEDSYGEYYQSKMRAAGVSCFMGKTNQPTGTSIIFITPDANRTMATYLGAGSLLENMTYVPVLALSKRFFVAGYLFDLLDCEELIRRVLCKGARLVFSLSDPDCVERHKERFIKVIKEYRPLLFCNYREAVSITDCEDIHECCRKLGEWTNEINITNGEHPSLLMLDGQIEEISPPSINPVDTTGCGDGFVAGYLYGKINNLSPQQSVVIAHDIASRIAVQIGPRIKNNLSIADIHNYVKATA